ncbi:MAG: hypothetical protein K6C31_06700 [Bacteroidales bacterium]|nr:hypothetical protein [Bacteroidales bacterium]
MKKILTICSVGLMALAMASCGQKAPEVDAIVAGGAEPFALLLEYDAPVLAECVNAQTFAVPGKEVRSAFVTDVNPFGDKGQRGPGRWMADRKDGKYVVVVLDGGKPMGKPEGECEKCEEPKDGCEMAECDHEGGKPCDKPEAEKCDKCKAAEAAAACDKPEAEKCDSCKHEEGMRHHGDKPCDKACEDAAVAVPEITVQQVADIKTADGKTLKAWKKAVKAGEVISFMGHRPGHHHHHHAEAGKAE